MSIFKCFLSVGFCDPTLNHPSFQDKLAVTHKSGLDMLWVLAGPPTPRGPRQRHASGGPLAPAGPQLDLTGLYNFFPPFPTTGKNPFPKHVFFPFREKGQNRLGAFCRTCSLGLRVSIRASITNRMFPEWSRWPQQ